MTRRARPGAADRAGAAGPEGRPDLRLPGGAFEMLRVDHRDKRQTCRLRDRLAAQQDRAGTTACRAGSLLRGARPLHMSDEEEDLFPLLQRRCAPEAVSGRPIDRPKADHCRIAGDIAAAVDILDRVGTRARTGNDAALMRAEPALLTRCAARLRHHPILENAIPMPFARRRLTADDTESARSRMMQRRGLHPNGERPDAR